MSVVPKHTGNVIFPFLTTGTEMFETPVLLDCHLRSCNAQCFVSRFCIIVHIQVWCLSNDLICKCASI